MKKEYVGGIMLFLTAIIWGLAFIFVEIALDAGWGAFPLLFARGIIGGTLSFIFCFKTRFYRDKKILFEGFIVGTFLFFGYAFQTIGQMASSVANTAFFTSLNIVFVPIFALLIYKKKIEKKVILAILIAIIGSAVLSFENGIKLNIGDILLVICAIFFALQITYSGNQNSNNTLGVTTVYLFTMAFYSLIAVIVTNDYSFSLKGFTGVLYAGIFSSFIATVFQLKGQTYLSESKASLILSQETVLAVIFSVVFLHEMISINQLIGGFLLILAVLVVTIKLKKIK